MDIFTDDHRLSAWRASLGYDVQINSGLHRLFIVKPDRDRPDHAATCGLTPRYRYSGLERRPHPQSRELDWA